MPVVPFGLTDIICLDRYDSWDNSNIRGSWRRDELVAPVAHTHQISAICDDRIQAGLYR